MNLNVPSDTLGGRSYITYVFRDAQGNVTYVGRASGAGTPNEVLRRRLSRGHDQFQPGLSPEIVDVQGSKLASQGAEEVFIQGYRDLGEPLMNVDEALSFKNENRIAKSLEKLEAFFEDLSTR